METFQNQSIQKLTQQQTCFTDFDCENLQQFCDPKLNLCKKLISKQSHQKSFIVGINYDCQSYFSDNNNNCINISQYTDIYTPQVQKIQFCQTDDECPQDRQCINFWNQQKFKTPQKICQTFPVYGQIQYAKNLVNLMQQTKQQCIKSQIPIEKCIDYHQIQKEFNDLRAMQQHEPNFSLAELLSENNQYQFNCISQQILVSDQIKQLFTPTFMISHIKSIQNNQKQLRNLQDAQPDEQTENPVSDGEQKKQNQQQQKKGDFKIYFIAIGILGVLLLLCIIYKACKKYLKSRPGDLEALKDNINLIKKQEVDSLQLEKNLELQSNNQVSKPLQQASQMTQYASQNQESDIRQQIQKINLDNVNYDKDKNNLETSVDKKFFVIDNGDDEENPNNQDKVYDNVIESNREEEEQFDQDSSIQYSNVFNLEGESSKTKTSSRKRRFKNTFSSKNNLNNQNNVNQSSNNNNSILEFNTQQ